jgi:hypothetical protein
MVELADEVPRMKVKAAAKTAKSAETAGSAVDSRSRAV